MVTTVAKYVCGKLVVQRVLVAVVANVANSICDYLTIRLFALDFYRVIADEGAAQISYHA